MDKLFCNQKIPGPICTATIGIGKLQGPTVLFKTYKQNTRHIIHICIFYTLSMVIPEIMGSKPTCDKCRLSSLINFGLCCLSTTVTLYVIIRCRFLKCIYSVMQSSEISLCGDVVYERIIKESRDEDNILDQKYKSKCLVLIMKFLFFLKFLTFHEKHTNITV